MLADAPNVVAIALASLLAACAAPGAWQCARTEQVAVQDTLYFGTATPDGVVSEAEWSAFLESTVTPRLPQGLTVSAASGQWRGRDGSIVREATHVLHLVHPGDPHSDAAVAAIVGQYKTQFRQEAVLRVRTRACTSL